MVSRGLGRRVLAARVENSLDLRVLAVLFGYEGNARTAGADGVGVAAEAGAGEDDVYPAIATTTSLTGVALPVEGGATQEY